MAGKVYVVGRNFAEAKAWALANGMRPYSKAFVYFGSARSSVGARFSEGDRVVVLPGFDLRDRRSRRDLILTLRYSARKSIVPPGLP